MAAQGETLARTEVPNLDGRVNAAAGEERAVKVEADHTLCVAVERADTFPCAPVPNAKRVVHAGSDKLNLIELQSTQRPGVTLETTNLFTSLKIPYPSRAVKGPRDEDGKWEMRKRLAELQAHDAIGMPLQSPNRAPTPSPITLNF